MADENTNDEVVAVTGRPNDTPIRDPEPAPLGGNSTFAERAKGASKNTKRVDDDTDTAEDKAVSRASTKRASKK